MTERHTSQGRARGQSWDHLDDDQPYDPRKDAGSGVSADARRAAYRRTPRLGTMSLGGCWCGLPMTHDWPGKADGAPHPRGQV